jgi:hypothetical protein
MAMAGEARARGWSLRRQARLLMSPNKLRRPSDRIEAAIVVLLAAVFLAAVAAAPYLGVRAYRWERVRAAHLHPAVAVLSGSGPTNSYWTGYGQATARWRAADGQWRSGTLTTETAPGIAGAPAGTRVRVWLTGSGEPADPPVSGLSEVFGVVMLAFAALCVTGVALAACYCLPRLVLDRRRLAGWASDWALTGPQWTTRPG